MSKYTRETMKIAEFIKREDDIDVYDNVCEELGIAFCGPLELTEEGKEHFKEVLDYDINVCEGSCCAVVNIDFDDWEERLRKAKEFFYSAAGYVEDVLYQKWFVED